MNIFAGGSKQTNLDKEIDRLIAKLESMSPDSKEYQVVADNLERLNKSKGYEKPRGVSLDTIAIVAGNLLGIAMILWHERAEVITTKALGFVLKGRV